MRRLHTGDTGERVYRHLHLFRQQVYLNRLLRAAHELGYGGSWPSDNGEAEQMFTDHMNFLLKWTRWYDPLKLVNSFPSRLKEGAEFSVHREEGNTFRVSLNFEQGLISEFKVSF